METLVSRSSRHELFLPTQEICDTLRLPSEAAMACIYRRDKMPLRSPVRGHQLYEASSRRSSVLKGRLLPSPQDVNTDTDNHGESNEICWWVLNHFPPIYRKINMLSEKPVISHSYKHSSIPSPPSSPLCLKLLKWRVLEAMAEAWIGLRQCPEIAFPA